MHLKGVRPRARVSGLRHRGTGSQESLNCIPIKERILREEDDLSRGDRELDLKESDYDPRDLWLSHHRDLPSRDRHPDPDRVSDGQCENGESQRAHSWNETKSVTERHASVTRNTPSRLRDTPSRSRDTLSRSRDSVTGDGSAWCCHAGAQRAKSLASA